MTDNPQVEEIRDAVNPEDDAMSTEDVLSELRKSKAFRVAKSHGGWIITDGLAGSHIVCHDPDQVSEWLNHWLA